MDASHEPTTANPGEVAGIGGILYNQLANPTGHFSEWINKDDVARIGREGSENPIFELECYAILAGLLTWKPIVQFEATLHGEHQCRAWHPQSCPVNHSTQHASGKKRRT